MSWNCLPPEVLCGVFSELCPDDVRACGSVCKTWNAASLQSSVWRKLLARDMNLPSSSALTVLAHDAHTHPHAARSEYRRCTSHWKLTSSHRAHSAPLTYVTLSHDAMFCCTTSQDSTFTVWCKDANSWRVLWQDNVQPLGWSYPTHAQFSPPMKNRENWLLVGGILQADSSTARGELAVYGLSESGLRLLSRVSLCPVSARGCWAWQDRVLTVSQQAAVTTLWLSAATQEVDSELTPVMRKLCRVFSDIGSVPRLLEICSVKLRPESGVTMVELWDDAETMKEDDTYYYTVCNLAKYTGNVEAEESNEMLLIYTSGLERSSAHAVCFTYLSAQTTYWPATERSEVSLDERIRAYRQRKQMEKEREPRTEKDEEAELEALRTLCTPPDRVVDLQGLVVGLVLAPEHTMIYAAVHVWRGGGIECRVRLCALSTSEPRVIWRSSPPTSPATVSRQSVAAAELLYYVQPAVSTHYVATPMGGLSVDVCMWSRLTGVLICTLSNSEPAHCVALVEDGWKDTLLCATDHELLKVWENGLDDDE